MQTPIESRLPRPSLARFTTRDLLWLMVACSVLSAILAAVLPNVSKDRQPRFLIAVAIAVGVTVLSAATALVLRARVERKAGASLAVIHRRMRRRDWLWLAVLIIFGPLALVATVFAITTDGLHAILQCWGLYWMAVLAVQQGFAALWGQGRMLEFCENGLIYQGRYVIPLEKTTSCRWGESLPNRLFIQVQGGVRCQIDVDPLQRDRVSQLLAEHVPVFRAEP